MYYVVYNTLGGEPIAFGSNKPQMATIKVEVGDGSENQNVEIPSVAVHTIVIITFTGTVDNTVFVHLPDEAEVGDLFELISLGSAVAVIATNVSIYGIAVAESKRSVLSVRKISESSQSTDAAWIGSQSLPPSWI